MPQDNSPASQESADDTSFESAFSQAAATQPPAQSSPQPAAAPPAQPPTSPAPQASAPAAPQRPSAPAPAAQAPPAAAPAAAPQASPLFDEAKKFGLKLDGIKSSDELARALLDHVRSISPYADLGRQSIAKPQQPAPAPAAPPAPAEKPWSVDDHFAGLWNVPAQQPIHQQLIERGLVQIGDMGLYEPVSGAEALVLPHLQSLNDAHIARYEARQAMFEGNPYKNFHDALYPAIERQLLAKVEELIGGRFERAEQQDALSQFETDNKAWLYDQAGQFTEHGQKFAAAVQALREGGITNPTTLISFAKQIVPPPAAQPAAPAAAPATPAQAQPPAAPPASQQESFLGQALDRARHSPQSQGHSQSTPHAPVNVEEAELENLFKHSFQQTRGAAA